MKALREPVSLRYDHDHGPDGRTPYDHPDCAGCLGERAARLLRDHDQRLLPALVLAILARLALPSEGLNVEWLAKEMFLYRTSSNIPLPADFWERQSKAMREPFLIEAAAICAALTPADPSASENR